MASKKQYLGVVCAKLVGTGQLYEDQGETTARELVSRTFDLLFEVVHRDNGRVSESVGDEIIATFGDIEHAARAAQGMHRALVSSDSHGSQNNPMALRVSVEFGQVVVEGNVVHGDVVDRATRLAGQAQPGQTVMTRGSAKQLSNTLQQSLQAHGSSTAAGSTDNTVVTLDWRDPQDPPHGGSSSAGTTATPDGLNTIHLRHHSTRIDLTSNRPSAVLGRSPICDIKTDEVLSSRQHVRIELRHEVYYVIDQSTNGTYVRTADGEEFCLSNEALPIEGDLEISLGRSFADDPQDIVYLQCGGSSESTS